MMNWWKLINRLLHKQGMCNLGIASLILCIIHMGWRMVTIPSFKIQNLWFFKILFKVKVKNNSHKIFRTAWLLISWNRKTSQGYLKQEIKVEISTIKTLQEKIITLMLSTYIRVLINLKELTMVIHKQLLI